MTWIILSVKLLKFAKAFVPHIFLVVVVVVVTFCSLRLVSYKVNVAHKLSPTTKSCFACTSRVLYDLRHLV